MVAGGMQTSPWRPRSKETAAARRLRRLRADGRVYQRLIKVGQAMTMHTTSESVFYVFFRRFHAERERQHSSAPVVSVVEVAPVLTQGGLSPSPATAAASVAVPAAAPTVALAPVRSRVRSAGTSAPAAAAASAAAGPRGYASAEPPGTWMRVEAPVFAPGALAPVAPFGIELATDGGLRAEVKHEVCDEGADESPGSAPVGIASYTDGSPLAVTKEGAFDGTADEEESPGSAPVGIASATNRRPLAVTNEGVHEGTVDDDDESPGSAPVGIASKLFIPVVLVSSAQPHQQPLQSQSQQQGRRRQHQPSSRSNQAMLLSPTRRSRPQAGGMVRMGPL